MGGNSSLYPADSASMPEVHGTVGITHPNLWKRLFAFAGPAYLVSVGYMDPGNWATDLEGGARFGYKLLWVLVASNLMAILLQTLSARLGIVTQRDLAQACRESYSRFVSWTLWVLCEIAIAACDLAEVLGAAIALNLLFHVPILIGIFITTADTLLILLLTRIGIRVVESIILVLIATIAFCFAFEIWLAGGVSASSLLHGIIPTLDSSSLYVAIGILGATVMPHNLYLHSSLVQTRRIGTTTQEKRTACKYNFIDSAIALNGALFVNAAILILAATVFFRRGILVTEIQQAHMLLAPLLGTKAASVFFGVALLCSGQSSTLTGTMAGQIVMEGFLNFRMRAWLRRFITRMIAVIPAAIVVYIAGEQGTYKLLILSQVILSLQLPFAVIPLVQFTSNRQRMGSFANPLWVKILAWSTAFIILGLNIWLVWQTIGSWFSTPGAHTALISLVLFPTLAGLSLLLFWIGFPGFHRRPKPTIEPYPVAAALPIPAYRKILVPLDHSPRDSAAVAHAAGLARLQGATLFLFHVEEGVTSQVFGALASTAEVEAGQAYLAAIASTLGKEGIRVQTEVAHASAPVDAILRYARQIEPDLIVMGAHGHTGIKDLVLGHTINSVRHRLRVPVMVVQSET